MGAFDSKVSDIKSELNDWLNVRGGEVQDLALSLINRAIDSLWRYRAWDLLIKNHTFTLDSNNQSLMPADFGRIIFVGYDSNGDGVPDWFFFNGCKDTGKRYDLTTTFSKTTGLALTIKFPSTPSANPVMKYVIGLDKVEIDTDYLFFPSTLVLRAAQKAHAIDKSISGLEVNAINNDYDALLRDYSHAYYHIDRSMEMFQQDKYFNAISNEGYSLDGAYCEGLPNRGNSFDS
jgi:hypothetical protein